MIDGILETTFPGASWTWEWLSRGGGRVDRLSVWVGSLSSDSPNRCIRVGRKRLFQASKEEALGLIQHHSECNGNSTGCISNNCGSSTNREWPSEFVARQGNYEWDRFILG